VLTPATHHSNEEWVCEQARAFVKHARRVKLPIDIVMHDRDSTFNATVDDEFRAAGIRVQKVAYRSPNTVAYVERFIQKLQQELLDHFMCSASGT
jgi:hypothetical protein